MVLPKKSDKFTDDASYYADKDYISSSFLANFVTFDIYGTPIYNIFNAINPPEASGTELEIGRLVDDCATGDSIVDVSTFCCDNRSKSDWENLMELNNIDGKARMKELGIGGQLTMDLMRRFLEEAGVKLKKEVAGKIYNSAKNIIDTMRRMRYDAKQTLVQYLAECEKQFAIHNDEWGMRGKFDYINFAKKRISDLKTCGNLDRLLKELTFRGEINIYHKYTRQLAIYRHLVFLQTGEWYECELIIIDAKGRPFILRIDSKALDLAFIQVQKDLAKLQEYASGTIEYAVYFSSTEKNPGEQVQAVLTDDEGEDDEDEEEQLY